MNRGAPVGTGEGGGRAAPPSASGIPGRPAATPSHRLRVLSERKGRLLLNLYPPLFFQRIRCVEIGPGYRSCRMRIARSLLTRNLNGTTFGGTIFSAADPVYALLFWQIYARLGQPIRVWLKSGSADYRRPASSALVLDFAISDADLAESRAALAADGRWIRTYRTEARDREGTVCALLDTEIYMRLPRGAHDGVSGF